MFVVKIGRDTMKVLSVNAGSSSLKFKLYNMPFEEELVYGYIEKIGGRSTYKIIINGKTKEYQKELKNHRDAVDVLMHALIENNVIKSIDEIKAVGHRIVNGAGKYKPTLVDDDEIKRLEKVTLLSLVHMPGHIAGIKAFREVAPKMKQVLIFDTAFHHTIPKENYLYAVPYEWYEKYKIRKFGFHGISCAYITSQMEKIFERKVNLIICHIGNGASVTSVKSSKSFNTSMGFTANAGLMMGTRCGTIDYSIIPYLLEVTGLSMKEIDKILNTKSGLEGICPGASDNRDLEKLIDKGDKKAILANKMYINRIISYIGSYIIMMDKIDAIVLCGGVGENAVRFRASVLNGLSKLGIKIDNDKNEKIHKFSKINSGIITTDDSSLPVYVVPTDEEIVIARETYKLIK